MGKRAKKSGSPKKKTTRKKNKRKAPAAAAAPAPKRTARKRARKSGGGGKKKSARKRSGKRSSAKRPLKRKRTSVKAHQRHVWKRNPGGAIVQAGLGAAAGLLGFLVTLAATYYVTKDGAQQSRNKKIVAGVIFAVAALLVAKKRPVLAAGLATGAGLAAFSDYATLKMMQYLPQKTGGTTAGLTPIGAVYQQNMRGLQQVGAVYEQNMQGVPTAPWLNPGPFG